MGSWYATQTSWRYKWFKQLYIKELQKLTEDGIDNTAISVQQALIARVDAFELEYETEVQTLNNNQLTLETAFQVLIPIEPLWPQLVVK